MNRRTIMTGLAVALATGGCIEVTTMRSDEPRAAVRFESPGGAQAFYEAYIVRSHTRMTGICFCVGVPYPYQHKVLVPENVCFNAAVKAADANGDGIISDAEARRYAEQVRPTTVPAGFVRVAKG